MNPTLHRCWRSWAIWCPWPAEMSLASILWASLLALTACTAIPSVDARHKQATEIAARADWQSLDIQADPFVLRAYIPTQFPESKTLTLYIEGDGLAWISRDRPSRDPTPIRPMALELAVRHPQHAAAYLARPCQFVSAAARRGCVNDYWTDKRFAPEVIAAASNAIDQLKQRTGAEQLVLIGYSGGGAVAALVAAQRDDVARLVTIAGNLDHATWTTLHRVTPLQGSLNPIDVWPRLQHLPQLHLVGAHDRIMPASIADSYRAHFPAQAPLQVRLMPGFDHHCCWVEHWPALLDP